MSLKQDLQAEVRKIITTDRWQTRDGIEVPEAEDLGLGNEAVKLNGTVLYADLSGSTRLVDTSTANFAAEVYKAYLHCAAKLIRDEGGTITAYDGDRIMGVFIGDLKNTSAVTCGLKINYAVREIINPAIKAEYPQKDFSLRQVVGIDTSSLWITRTGVRGANDLVWVGRAANYAAKLTELDADYPTRITAEVFKKLHDSAKNSEGKSMWEARNWTNMNNILIYRSTYWWKF